MRRILICFFFLFTLYSCDQKHVYELASFQNRDELKLCFMGDLGKGGAYDGMQAAVAESMEKQDCDRIYLLGDLIYPKGIEDENDPDLEDKFFRHYRKLPNSSKKPSLALVLGNHDYEGNIEAWFKVAKKEPTLFFPNYYYLEKIKGLCILSLDTNVFGIGVHWKAAMDEIIWLFGLQDLLEKDCSTKIVLGHHPHRSKGKHGNADGLRKRVFETFFAGKFDFIISGHSHFMADMGVQDGTRQLVSGAGGVPDKGYLPGYLVLSVKKLNTKRPEIDYQVIEIKDYKLGPTL